MLVQHLSGTSEAYTPRYIIDAVVGTMGRIDLDPASCEIANEIVNAERYFTQEEDGLNQPWSGRVFLNPPGGKVKGRSAAAQWWAKLYREWFAGNVTEAIFVAFNMSIFRTAQSAPIADGPAVPAPFESPFCVPADRIRYGKPVDGRWVTSKDPPQDSAIIYLPPGGGDPSAAEVRRRGVWRFVHSFKPLGGVRG